MADLLVGVDFAADFEKWAQGLEDVTVQSIDGRIGAVLASKANVKAAKLITKRETGPARGGSVPNTGVSWWLRVDQLGFVLKTQDRIVRTGGETWVLDEVNEEVAALARCPATKKKG